MLMKTFSAMALPIIGAGMVLFCGCSAILSARGTRTELKDWQTSLTRFIQHVDSVHNSHREPGNISITSDLVHFSNMTNGGCAGENADDVFGPRVQFEGNFIRVSALPPDQRDQHWQEHFVAMSFEGTSPGAILYVQPAEADLASWQRLSPGAQVRFQAELNCLTAWEIHGEAVGYSLVLNNAKVLP